ncbi:hypothetical protein K490DRAFT_70042 [Saccharata proteae CBS 121410]|uniref:tRNA(Phe) 7-[(3-amino-3-carboxypropyl)-4-demethylwyosine(37)-N(4)]-methyltransferase n=1 Tax=Saccharata proteae CBS 121410 TaxID=1314787 RepID=A0A9P4LUL1_9PEZI|nr:hypothetical protein K490DRAFT_70042 [Saccharata proteae CBS 121410]
MASFFAAKKQHILQQIARPEDEYSDLSPKGTIDEGIRTLIDEINAIDGLVTTSSCSGRLSVFLEGKRKTATADLAGEAIDQERELAGPGGKGGGGQWLFVSHDPLEVPANAPSSHFQTLFGMDTELSASQIHPFSARRLVHLKFEAMILHLLTASLDDAQRLLSAALQAGFRESGAVSLSTNADGHVSPMVAVRSIGLTFDSVIGYQSEDGRILPVVDESYLRSLVDLANSRFVVNAERIERFRSDLNKQQLRSEMGVNGMHPRSNSAKSDWEDPAIRRARKRAEGLKHQRSIADKKSNANAPTVDDDQIPLSDVF